MDYRLMMRAKGKHAVFTRPEFSAERLSYEAPPHSQARGILEAHYWKPEMFYTIEKIDILSPIRWWSEYRNEVKDFGNGRTYRIKDNLTQRMTTGLVDVDYVIYATVHVSRKGLLDGEKAVKHFNIITHRARKGEHFRHPFFGMREYSADVTLLEDRNDAPPPADVNIDMGIMHFDRKGYCTGNCTPDANYFHEAKITKGVLEYPTYAAVEAANLCIGAGS